MASLRFTLTMPDDVAVALLRREHELPDDGDGVDADFIFDLDAKMVRMIDPADLAEPVALPMQRVDVEGSKNLCLWAMHLKQRIFGDSDEDHTPSSEYVTVETF